MQYPTSANKRAPRIDTTKQLGFTGLETTLIDYTLSRANMDASPSESESVPSPTSAKSRKDKLRDYDEDADHETAYLDLSSPTHAALFTADATDEYQYDIYRYMRNAVLTGEPLPPTSTSPSASTPVTSNKRNKQKGRRRKSAAPLDPFPHASSSSTRDQKASKTVDANANANANAKAEAQTTTKTWRTHHPLTNLIWLHFVLHKLLSQLSHPLLLPCPIRVPPLRDIATCSPSISHPLDHGRIDCAADGVAHLGSESGARAQAETETKLQNSLIARIHLLRSELRLESLGERSRSWCSAHVYAHAHARVYEDGDDDERKEKGDVRVEVEEVVEGAAGLARWAVVEKGWFGWGDVLGLGLEEEEEEGEGEGEEDGVVGRLAVAALVVQ